MKIENLYTAIVLFAISYSTQSLAQAQADATRRPIIWKNTTVTVSEIKIAKTAVIDQLKDPESAKFDKIWALKGSNGARTVCGYVNAKNSYGGYVGKKMFVVIDDDRIAFEDDDVFGSLLPNICLPRTVN